jgi:hypothetical protein
LAADDAERRRRPAEDGLTQWRRRAAERRQVDLPDFVTKDYAGNPRPEPEAMVRMTVEAERQWNAWAEAHISAALDAYTEMIAEAVGELLRDQRQNFEARLKALRRDLRKEFAR